MAGTELQAELSSGSSAVLTAAAGLVEISCTKSTLAGNSETTETPHGALSSLTFSGCNNTVEVLKAGTLEVHWDAAHNGLVTARGFKVRVKASGLTCTFGGEIKEGLTLSGGSPATVTATANVPLEEGFFCPSTAVWHAQYKISQPAPLYVIAGENGAALLCASTSATCTEPVYAAGTEVKAELESGTESVLTAAGGLGQISCKASTLSGTIEALETPHGSISSLTFGECSSTVEVLKAGELEVHWDAEHNGQITIKGFEVRVKAGGLTCTFGGNLSEAFLTLFSGNPATVAATPALQLKSGESCPSSAFWHATYRLTAPQPLYVAKAINGATILCSSLTSICNDPYYGAGTEVKAELEGGTETILTAAGGLVEIKCSKSTLAGTTETVDTPRGKPSSLTFSECNNSVEVLNSGEIELHWDSEHNGKVEARNFEVRVKASGLTCIFGSVTEGVTLTGGSPPIADATATVNLKSGFFCPASAVWHAKYKVTAPESLYVTSS
jgi:cytoskeletal protein CcmA (bactofilin family)